MGATKLEMTDDELVASLYGIAMTPPVRRRAMIDACRAVENIPGDIVECGVFRGANIIIARKVLPDRVCWLYDTFAGMTEPEPVDTKRSGAPAAGRKTANWCLSPLEEVRGYLEGAGVLDDTKLKFVVGDVLKTLRVTLPERIALLRLDTDWYASTKLELEVLYPLLSSGGVLLIDDYGHWLGARAAVDEYFGNREWDFIDYSCVRMVKP
jgi:O-methyltransferase